MSTPREKIVFISAHPDDTEGFAATAFLLRNRYELHVIDLTHGELGLGRVGLVHHHRHDHPRRREVDDPLDLGVVAGGDAVERRHPGALHRHQVQERRVAVHLAVLAVDPDEVEAGGAGDLGHRRVRKGYARPQRRTRRTRLFEEPLEVVDFHGFVLELTGVYFTITGAGTAIAKSPVEIKTGFMV